MAQVPKFKTVAMCLCIIPTMATTAATMEAGAARQDAKGIAQVFVPAGCFQMGSSQDQINTARGALNPPGWAVRAAAAEKPQHIVCVNAVWIDQTEVTNASFTAFIADGGYANASFWSSDGAAWLAQQNSAALPATCPDGNAPDHPRTCVTWFEAEAYAAWRGGRLPTEAEWEYAARGPSASIYPWGDQWDPSRAHVLDAKTTAAVGKNPKGKSWVGALDMSGNVMEWVSDWLGVTYYKSSPKDDPKGPETGNIKVEKGGWWGSNAFVSRSAYRHFEDPPTYQDHHIGFRIVIDDIAGSPN